MPSVKTRLERLERARTTDVRCVWLYVGWKDRGGFTVVGDEGVYRVFVPTLPPALPPGLLVVLRHSNRDGAEVSAEAAHWALAQLALSPRQRALIAQSRILVLITAGGSEPPPEAEADDAALSGAEAAGAAPPGAETGSPPAAAGPSPPAAKRPPPPAAAPQWPEWLPR